MFDMNIGVLDTGIVLLFLAVMLVLGCWVGWTQRRGSQGSDYFLASRSLIWPVIGLSLFSTNISTIELVSLAEEGYKSGLVYGNLEWMAALSLVVLAIFFAPFYISSKVATLPDFLLKRYNNKCRVFQVVITIFSAIFIHTGFALFAGAKVMEGLFGLDIMWSITIVLLLTGFYTIVGGLKAVVLTDSVATVVLILGSVIMAVIGYDKVGGWEGIKEVVDPEKLTLLRSAASAKATGAADMNWYSILLGYPIIGIWYFCTDQTIVQRVLGAKDEKHAQLGPIFAGFIKILPIFIFVLPGVICFALIQKGMLGALPLDADGNPDTAQTYGFLLAEILPVGVKGIVAAAMLAALMSTISSALNSIATVFCYDIYKPLRPDCTEKQMVLVGRVATIIAMVLAIMWAPRVADFESILQGNTSMICYIAPSLTAVFLGGVLWKGASGRGAFITLCFGTAIGAVIFVLDFFMGKWDISFMLTSFYMFVVCVAILFLSSIAFPQEHTEESRKLIWDNPLDALKRPGWKGVANYKFLSALLLVIMLVLYLIFDLHLI